jgi:hypothetical protein
LRQLAAEDKAHFVKAIYKQQWQNGPDDQLFLPLHQYEDELVLLIKCSVGSEVVIPEHKGGDEILLLLGKFKDEQSVYSDKTWLRRLYNGVLTAETDSLIWLKLGYFTG